MIYSEPLFNQISRFVTAIGFGFILCALYIALCFIRFCISDSRWAVIAQDLIFGITSTVLSFFFMIIYNNGLVRFNLVVSQVLGGAVLYICLGRYLLRLLRFPAIIIRKGIRLLVLPFELYALAFPRTVINQVEKIKVRSKNKGDKKEKGKRKNRVKKVKN